MPSLNHFTASRQPRWTELEALLARSEGNGLRSFDADQIEALARAYRQVVSDLALAQRDFPDDQLTLWLNGLASRAHLRLYRAPAPSWRRFGRFFWTDFARRFRAARPYLLVSAVLLFGPAALAYVGALLEPTLRDALVPASLRQVMSSGRTWTDIQPALRPGIATLIFTNNIQVSFLAFAGGVLCGLGTVYVLVSKGLLVVAGLIEGFISPSDLLIPIKLAFGPLAGLILYALLLTVGTRSGSGEPAAPRRQSLLRSFLAARSFPRRPPAQDEVRVGGACGPACGPPPPVVAPLVLLRAPSPAAPPRAQGRCHRRTPPHAAVAGG